MYADHAWPAEVHSDDDAHFGDKVFKFGPFVPFVDLPGLVNRATWCNPFLHKEIPVQVDGQVELRTLRSAVPGTSNVSAVPGTSNVVACDQTVFPDATDHAMSSDLLAGRTRYDVQQTRILVTYYSQDPKPKYLRRKQLAKEAGMTYVQVTTWFNNRRKREAALGGNATLRPPRTIRRVGL